MRECNIKFTPESLAISKEKRFFDGEHNPMINVGSDWPDGLACKTAVNLGNPNTEGKWLRNTAIIVVLTILCTGATSWPLLVVESEWNWVKLLAVPVLHFCLMSFLALPLFHERQSARPYQWFSEKKWDVLTRRILKIKEGYARAAVLEGASARWQCPPLQGRHILLSWYSLQVLVILVTSLSVASYLCQYAILKRASNRQAIIWIPL